MMVIIFSSKKIQNIKQKTSNGFNRSKQRCKNLSWSQASISKICLNDFNLALHRNVIKKELSLATSLSKSGSFLLVDAVSCSSTHS